VLRKSLASDHQDRAGLITEIGGSRSPRSAHSIT